jgi:protein O-mannosyl-transferase
VHAWRYWSNTVLVSAGKSMYDEASHKSYRPLTILSFRLDWLLGGHTHDATLFHTVNVVLHCAVCAATTLLSLSLFPREPWTATFGGLLFAVHPVHVEAVVGLVSRADLLCTLCFVGSVQFHWALRAKDAKSAADWLKFAGLLYTCVLCKEIGIFLLPLCAAVTCAQRWLSFKPVLQEVMVLVALGLPYVVLRTWLATPPGQSVLSLSASTLQHSQLLRKAENPFVFLNGTTWVMSVGYLQAKYAQLLVWPVELCAEYSFNCIPAVESIADPRNASTLFVCLLIAGLAAHLFCSRRTSASTLLFLMMLVPYIPASNLFFRIGACQDGCEVYVFLRACRSRDPPCRHPGR